MCKVSVALLTYNRPDYLNKAIEGILNQTYSDFEFLICDNGSGEETQKIINSYQDRRIKVVRNSINSREFYNVPFFEATGDYLIITHDDDIMESELLEKEVNFLDKSFDAVAVGCNMSLINPKDDTIMARRFKFKETFTFSQNKLIDHFLAGIFPFCSTVLMRRHFFVNNNLQFDLRVGPGADIFLWHKVSEYPVTICILPEALYRYRIHSNQDSQNRGAENQEMLLKNLIIDIEKKPQFKRQSIKLVMQLLYDNYSLLEMKSISYKIYRDRQTKLRLSYKPGLYILTRLMIFKFKRRLINYLGSLKFKKNFKYSGIFN